MLARLRDKKNRKVTAGGKPASTDIIVVRQTVGDRDHACQMVQQVLKLANVTTVFNMQSCWKSELRMFFFLHKPDMQLSGQRTCLQAKCDFFPASLHGK